MVFFLFPYGKQLKMKPRPQASNNILCSKRPAQHHMFLLICIAQPPCTSSYALAALGLYDSYGGFHPLKGNHSVKNNFTPLKQLCIPSTSVED